MRREPCFCRMVGALLLGAFGAGAFANDGSRVEDEVYEQLSASGDGTVYVTIVLSPPPEGVARDRVARREYVAEIQSRVLRVFRATEFKPGYQYKHVHALTGWVSAAGLEKLRVHPDVIAVGPDAVGQGHLDVSVPFINADDVHALGYGGAGITVAVLDTGIDTNHADLSDNIAVGAFHFLNQGATTGPGAEDDNGHGTNVSGIITSRGLVAPEGVAPDADILAVKVLDAGSSGFLSDWTAGVDYVVDNQGNYANLCAINMSLGSNLLQAACPCNNANAFNMALHAAIQAARDSGIVTFASSGNQGSCGTMSSPACLSSCVAVAAVYDQNLGTEPDFGTYLSNFGGTWPACSDASAPDRVTCFSNQSGCNALAAPGRLIRSSGIGGGTSTFTGTSQAAPHCAGVAALMCHQRASAGLPPSTADEIIQLLRDTGEPTVDGCAALPAPIRINALAAIEAACLLGFNPSVREPAGPSNPCDDGDVCTWDQCAGTSCTNVDNVYGDVNHDDTVDIFDILCVLDGFAGNFADCPFHDLDIAPCAPDGVIDIFDILNVLDAFAGNNICNCSAGLSPDTNRVGAAVANPNNGTVVPSGGH